MPLMIYDFIRGAIEEKGRPVSTKEIEDFARRILPMCADHVVYHLRGLELKGLVKKKLETTQKGYVWWIPRIYTIEELEEMYPDLYANSYYYRAVKETLGEGMGDIKDAIKILFKLSKGSEKRPSVEEIKRRLEDIR